VPPIYDLTTIGRARIAAMADGLVFEPAYVAVGTDGFDTGDPTIAEPLVPAATALGAEVYRAPVPTENFVVDSFLPGAYPSGPTSTGFLATARLAINGDALADAVGAEATALGEVGLIARITEVGTSGLTLGDEFLLAHGHFPRVIITRYMKLSTAWPISYTYDVILPLIEGFEYEENWPGTVALPTPVWGGAADIDESFELAGAWPGTIAPPAPVWGGAADLDEGFEVAEGWPI